MRDMVVGLVIEFFLGINLVTFGAFTPGGKPQTPLRDWTLHFHEGIGWLLVLTAIVVFIFAIKRPAEKRMLTATIGLIGVAVAITGGEMTEVQSLIKYAIFLMATGVIIGLISYMAGYLKSSPTLPPVTQ